ncbi:MAG TPA: pyruvate dehydrogenase (acetyl-transferring), homodimeric type [Phycisphaerae bacterium]|jgi:pyruvate dehydrogenase E1 component|nr:pyruvate dehydrogenase (acetyl-transferring), homodimeric type [Phycisphaerae bacterium]HOB75957.1 pyruvate dehydrogenase (acetyl-transferring), homodimeric type [Phycisphaerae bacterium]HOJ55563.1 pyruvate dehydrogenase (acetyl-transferring), homodimeric type [Phycisphaerae bacterium]HOL27595.1 pyruvate dehydrogenase (acetyl-transferring), homodimeric type [Phycisphaerae bacterium]HPP21837.1 pyruvate dehydrogenase (acetyl-transferring), homodimeric type [Phycisphaerae bacterium]
MADTQTAPAVNGDWEETREWLESIDYVLKTGGPKRALELLETLKEHLRRRRVRLPFTANTPYVNTIPPEEQTPYPGNRTLERRIKSIIRWNAMAMVVRANRESSGIGGHISTYASMATLYEVGFNHFFHGKDGDHPGDMVYFQGHSAPGIYARSFLEGRLGVEQLENFRRELRPGGGLSSYPHPWLMPDYWEFPTVSMGLGPIMAIYQARFNRYLRDRGIKDTSQAHVWAFLGDGECDEPETLGAITLASRERLDNLTFVINCNLQRLDGPVRGNGKIIQELEAAFRGAGWNVIKVIWSSDWDPLLAQDEEGWLVRRMGEVVDGEYQKYTVESGAYIREHFFGRYPQLLKMVEQLSDDHIQRMRRGGHDPEKVYAAYKAALDHKGAPTVILAKTVKGYGLGEAGEGRNITHQQKKLNEDELIEFRNRFGIPVSDEEVAQAPFYKPPDDSPEMKYLLERRKELGGFLPRRKLDCPPLQTPDVELFREFHEGTGDRQASTMMAFARLFAKLLREPNIGKLIVPIIPDEARTFGLEPLFRQVGIYSHVGQLYEPVDRDTLLYYRESKDGQILEEGITEAGSMCSFIAAGTAYANHGVNMIPFFLYYSMFGFQRIGDLVWAAADMRCKGFMMGGTAGRTTLAGEGLQHQDGHSPLLMSVVPSMQVYDPAFAYEMAVIVRDGIRRMYELREDIFYYLTIYNENYVHPPMPEGATDGILKGLYLFRRAPEIPNVQGRVQLFGSGPILRMVIEASELLRDRYQVAANVWSATSYNLLRRDCLEVERWNMLHPTEAPRRSYLSELLENEPGPYIAASDYIKAVPDQIAKWVPGRLFTLGTDGFGRSEDRDSLRRHFEIDAEHIAVAALYALAEEGEIDRKVVERAIRELGVDPDGIDPARA